MKVLFVSSGNSHYGIVPFIKSQGESLASEGVDIEYFTVNRKGIVGYLKNIKLIREYVRNKNFDIIHAHYGLIGLLCVLAFTGLPIVLSVMGSDAYGEFTINGKRKKSSYYIMFLTQVALLFVKQIIVKSENILDIVHYKKKSHLIPNGVNFKKFKPDSLNLVSKEVLFLAKAEDPRKNIRLAEKAIQLIGDNELQFLNPYPISHEEFPNYLNKCSVFLLTSYNEGSPNVIKEAMACNIPIVSTNVGDVKDVIGKTSGCYITNFEPEDVADKIKKALDFGSRTTGRNDIKHLESSVVARKIIKIYNNILDKEI